jgi:hypothetical protein
VTAGEAAQVIVLLLAMGSLGLSCWQLLLAARSPPGDAARPLAVLALAAAALGLSVWSAHVPVVLYVKQSTTVVQTADGTVMNTTTSPEIRVDPYGLGAVSLALSVLSLAAAAFAAVASLARWAAGL